MAFDRRYLWIFTLILTLAFFRQEAACAASPTVSVSGDVSKHLKLNLEDLKKLEPFHVNKVVQVASKKAGGQDRMIAMSDCRGVLLRDILEMAGMKHVRKYEPGVFIRVKGSGNSEVVFSFGEIFYSSIGRSVLIAYEKDGRPVAGGEGLGELVVTTDVRTGRSLGGVREIVVERVDVPMNAYEDRSRKIVRPPTSEFVLLDSRTRKSNRINLADLKKHDPVRIDAAVMAGDCEGFHGIYSFKGASLRSLLQQSGIDPSTPDYDRYVLICSENGFCATFSFGEIFNSRLSDNIIIAYEKDGAPLDPTEAFAKSVVRDDSVGGRSVRRISSIEIR
ncbi:MAG: molybdopterin-dependent oxidoreductase [Geobacteraceae bacterium]|nr:molybdopterin-dependent oxidoreductase [Geobacteraceae bacterium]